MSDSWILLRIPRSEGASAVSAVLSAGGELLVESGIPDIPTAIDRLTAAAAARGLALGKPTLIFPLDGRHGLAHVVLEQAEKRGYGFSRHVPPGQAAHLLDLDGADSAPGLAGEDELAALLDKLSAEAAEAMRDSELAEAMSALRQVVTVCARHLGWWNANTLWGLANLVKVAGATGADDNIREAGELVRHALAQPAPQPFPNVVRVLARFEEIARNAMGAGDAATAQHVLRAGVDLARRVEGEDHPNHMGMLNTYGLFLSARRDPGAEPVLRGLLAQARRTLGPKHPNIAVVLANLAELLENQGRIGEAAPLRAEAAEIRGTT